MLERVDIGKLLRIKRYERPPPDHFERFLDEFHRRYPAGPTRRSAWRSAVERLRADLARLAESRSACAAAGALAAVTITLALFHTLRPGTDARPNTVAAGSGAERTAPARSALDPNLELLFRDPAPVEGTTASAVYVDVASADDPAAAGQIRTQPVRYETPLSF